MELISAHRRISNLSELNTVNDLSLLDKCIPDEVVRRRARHVITENARTLGAINALEKR
ncbi:MAG: hypothetical protein MZV63_04135 [Marinilabiliales bacterium]|nr:hypothetical protein [Marinilabiliales bacterium]